jgi:IclR family acetate operon transcriptional repressor
MLAHSDEDLLSRLEEQQPFRKYTPNTRTDPQEIRAELERVRERGYALDLEEFEEGVRCVAAPILDARGRAVAAVSVSGPKHRLPKRLLQGELARGTMAAAREIGHRLGAR